MKQFQKLFFLTILTQVSFYCKGLTTQELLDGNSIPATKIKIIDPAEGSSGFALNGKIFLSSDENLKLSSLQDNATIFDASGNKVDFLAADRGGGVYTLAPSNSFQALTKYTVTIPTTVLDIRNKAIAASASVNFTTYGQLTIASHNFGSALPETTTSHSASITLNQSVAGMALSSNSLSVTTDTGCMNCVTLSGLSGSGAGPYTFTINGLLSANAYFVKIGSAVTDAAGNQANMQFPFYVAPVISLVKNPIGRGVVATDWGLDAYVPKIAADSAGNIYVSGNFSGTVNFGGGNRTPTASTTSPKTAMYVVKYSSTGAYLWDVMFDPASRFIYPRALIANNSAVYISGHLENTYTFPGYGTAVGNTNPGYNGGYIVKLDTSTGSATWAGGLHNSTLNSSAGALKFDGAGNLVMLYGLNSTSTAVSRTGSLAGCGAPSTGTSAYLLGIDLATGACRWTGTNILALGTTYGDPEFTFSGTSIYITGYLSAAGSVSIIAGAPALSQTGGVGNAYVVKLTYDSSTTNAPSNTGAWAWRASGNSVGKYIVPDTANSDLFVLGQTYASTDFGCSPTPCASVGTSNTDLVLFRIPMTGSSPTWAKSYGGNNVDAPLGLAIYNNRVRFMASYDLTSSNQSYNNFGCALFNGFGQVDYLLGMTDLSGNIVGSRFFGSPVNDIGTPIVGNNGFAIDSAGKMYGAMYMGAGKIGSTTIAGSSTPMDLVFWRME